MLETNVNDYDMCGKIWMRVVQRHSGNGVRVERAENNRRLGYSRERRRTCSRCRYARVVARSESCATAKLKIVTVCFATRSVIGSRAR